MLLKQQKLGEGRNKKYMNWAIVEYAMSNTYNVLIRWRGVCLGIDTAPDKYLCDNCKWVHVPLTATLKNFIIFVRYRLTVQEWHFLKR